MAPLANPYGIGLYRHVGHLLVSSGVTELIEEYQPLLALHGHIHESRGAATIGRTLAINSGSEYATGRIHGAIVKLSDDAVLSHQFTIG